MVTKVIFSFRKSFSRDVRTEYNLDLRFLVKFKKQISMIMADLSWGHINIFRVYTRGLCFLWYTRGLGSQVTQRTNIKIIICICLRDHSKLTMVCRF